MKNQGSEGIGGIWGFSADGDAPPRYGGDFWGFGGGLFWSSEGIGGRNPSDSRGGTCEHYGKENVPKLCDREMFG